MTWTQVARKDFEDAVRSRMVWSIVGLFAGFATFLILVLSALDDGEGSVGAAIGVLAELSQLFVPLIALIAGYMAIVGERRSGSLRMLLAYPHSRFDVVAGKLVGRAGVIAVAFSLGIALATAIAGLLGEFPSLGEFGGLLAVTVAFGMAFTGIAVGISAATRTRGRAMATAIGVFLVFFMFWDGVAAGAYYAVHGALPGLHPDAWYFLAQRLNPLEAFRVLADTVVESDVRSMTTLPVEDIPEGTPPAQLTLENRVEGALPFYLADWFAAVILLGWGLLAPAVGYLRFARSDL